MKLDWSGLGLSTETQDDYYNDPENVARYDEARRESAGGTYIHDHEKAWIDVFLARNGEDPDDLTGVSILDVGGGTGWVTRYLDEKGADVTYLDASPAMADAARTYGAEEGVEGVEYALGDATRLPYGTDTFDYAVAMRTGHVLPENRIGDFADELGRVARKGAFFDLFRGKSLRSGYTPILEMDSSLHTDAAVTRAIAEAPHATLVHHDTAFALPYGAFRALDNEPVVRALGATNETLTGTRFWPDTVSTWHIAPGE